MCHKRGTENLSQKANRKGEAACPWPLRDQCLADAENEFSWAVVEAGDGLTDRRGQLRPGGLGRQTRHHGASPGGQVPGASKAPRRGHGATTLQKTWLSVPGGVAAAVRASRGSLCQALCWSP